METSKENLRTKLTAEHLEVNTRYKKLWAFLNSPEYDNLEQCEKDDLWEFSNLKSKIY